AAGAVLVFEEVLSPKPGFAPDLAHRHAVRLTHVEALTDALYGESTGAAAQRLLNVEWDADDALPFPLCLWRLDLGPVHSGTGSGQIVPGGTNFRSLRIAVRIDVAGSPGTARFSWSGDGGKTFGAQRTVPASGTYTDAASGVVA